jgi:hypothetical protein
MTPTRSIIFLLLILGTSFSSTVAQGRGPRIPPRRDLQLYEPRTNLEEFESRLETVLIKGYTYVATLNGRNGSARIRAVEIRDAGNSTRASGVEITTTESTQTPVDVRSLIDYEEIDQLIRGLDAVAKADESITKLTHFEVRYRTRGDFEVLSFKQTMGGIAAAVESGLFERTRLLLTLDDLTKLRWMVLQAKARLDEIK